MGLPPTPTGSLQLAWDPSPDPTVVGYHVYLGVVSETYNSMVDALNQTNITLVGLVPGTTFYFAVTAYDITGLESGFSEEVSYMVPIAAPIPPGSNAHLSIATTPYWPMFLTASAPAGFVYDLDATADFSTWVTLETITVDSTGVFRFTDLDSSKVPHRFYRLRLKNTH